MAKFSAKSVRKENKALGIFHTNEKLANKVRDRLLEYTNIPVTEIVDFCVGGAGLLQPFGDGVKWYGSDVKPEFVEYCKSEFQGEFIEASAFDLPFGDKKFNHIVGNPPFSLKCDKVEAKRLSHIFNYPYEFSTTLDNAFIMANLHSLSDKGTCVLIQFPGVLYRGKKEALFRKYLLENNLIEVIEQIEADKNFDDTQISVTLMVLKKSRDKDTIRFINGEVEVEAEVKVSDILNGKDGDYNLSVNRYAFKENDKEAIDINALEDELITIELNNLRRRLEFYKITSQFDVMVQNGQLIPSANRLKVFIEGIKQIVKEYEGESK